MAAPPPAPLPSRLREDPPPLFAQLLRSRPEQQELVLQSLPLLPFFLGCLMSTVRRRDVFVIIPAVWNDPPPPPVVLSRF